MDYSSLQKTPNFITDLERADKSTYSLKLKLSQKHLLCRVTQ